MTEPREFRHRLRDMQAAIDGIEHAITGKSFEDYREDWLLKHAVERGIEIISEASRAIPVELQDMRPEVPWPRLRAIGNVLRHEYNKLSDPIIWRVATDELPRLRDALAAIQAAVGDGLR